MASGESLALPDGAVRHVQVLRLQPGDEVHLFDGAGRTLTAHVEEMGRKSVGVRLGAPLNVNRELPVQVTLAMAMPANDRMDALVEKASELGALAIQPLVSERSVLRPDGDRAAKKVAHWQAVAVSACEQSGRAVVPTIQPVQAMATWLKAQGPAQDTTQRRGVLSLREATSLRHWLASDSSGAKPSYVFLSGPEGGLSPAEEQLALDLGWQALSLGARVLRADTAPLAVLSIIGAHHEG